MPSETHLVLEDGSVFPGEAFGAREEASGEVVFTTTMTGYQEVLTDPSFAGQIVVATYPLIGNYGINHDAAESRRVQVRGFAVRQHCAAPSHANSEGTIEEYLTAQGIPGICGIDTRAVTRRLRSRGVMMGMISPDPGDAVRRLRTLPRYDDVDYVREVTADRPYTWSEAPSAGPKITVLDLGVKYNILRILEAKGCQATVVPASASPADVLAQKPDGLLLSPGPGDPDVLGYLTETAKALMGRVPILGICLGHQVIAHALGGKTYKLKFGHRGGNHPVKDVETGRVYITAQNHGYAVDGESLPPEVEVTHVNLNDQTVEGMRHRDLPVMTIQYHSEASPGPLDNIEIFDRFLDLVREHNKKAGR